MAHSGFVVWYLRGVGRQRKWMAALPVATQAEAVAQARSNERMGYPSVIARPGEAPPADTNPEWWNFQFCLRLRGLAGEDFDLDVYLAECAEADPTLAREFALIDARAAGG